MFTNGGVCVDSWVRVDGDCTIDCAVAGDEAQFRFTGARRGELNLAITEEGLEDLVSKGTEALQAMRVE